MSTAGNFPADKAGKSPESQHNHRLDQEPVDYAYLEEHLDELDLSPTHYETMEEKHRRQARRCGVSRNSCVPWTKSNKG